MSGTPEVKTDRASIERLAAQLVDHPNIHIDQRRASVALLALLDRAEQAEAAVASASSTQQRST